MTSMVLSFSRPDPSSPSAVAGATFSSARRGFDPVEVRDFLRTVSAEMARLQERVVSLERALRDAENSRPMVHSDMTEAAITELLGEETARIIEAAREAAHKIRERSEDAAGRIIKEATEEAARIREETELECARRRHDATSDAEAEVLMAKQQGREMVNEARSYRERVLADVARRREMAREQLQELHHGRERIVHAFERARTATDDVLRDLLEPADEPMEFVNLAPTTGPVPVIVQADDIERLEAIRPVSSAPDFGSDIDDDGSSALAESASDATAHIGAEIDGAEIDLGPADVEHDDEVDTLDSVAADEGEIDDADERTAEESSPVSNVVPLFARNDEHRYTPIVHRDVIVSDDDTGDDDDASHVDDGLARKRTPSKSRTDAGDIFERLRRASTESVAADASRHISRPPTIEPESIRQPVAGSHDDKCFDMRNEVLIPVIVAMSRMAKRVLVDEQNQVLDILRGKPIVRQIDVLVGSRSEHSSRYIASLSSLLGEAALAGARSLSDDSEDELVKKIEPQMSAITDFISSTLVEPLRERLERSISQSSESNAELAALVRLVYREWKNQFIDEHMDDIALQAYGRGAASVLNSSMRVCWKVDPNGPACADAEDNSLGGFVRGGEEFPTGHTHAPAHAGCRCVLVSDQN